jgi:hypothetical protein
LPAGIRHDFLLKDARMTVGGLTAAGEFVGMGLG